MSTEPEDITPDEAAEEAEAREAAEAEEAKETEAEGPEVPAIREGTALSVDSLFEDFDSEYRYELASEQERAKEDAKTYKEKAEKFKSLYEKFKGRKYDPKTAHADILELERDVNEMNELLEVEIAPEVTELLKKVRAVQEGIEKRAEALSEAGKDKDKVIAEITSSQKIQDFFKLTFGKLVEAGLSKCDSAIQEYERKANEAFMKTEEYSALAEQYSIFGTTYEKGEETLESIRANFEARVVDRFKETVNNATHNRTSYIDKLKQEREELQGKIKNLNWELENERKSKGEVERQLKKYQERLDELDEQIMGNEIISILLAEKLVKGIERVMDEHKLPQEEKENLFKQLPLSIFVRDSITKHTRGGGTLRPMKVYFSGEGRFPEDDLLTQELLKEYAKVMCLINTYNKAQVTKKEEEKGYYYSKDPYYEYYEKIKPERFYVTDEFRGYAGLYAQLVNFQQRQNNITSKFFNNSREVTIPFDPNPNTGRFDDTQSLSLFDYDPEFFSDVAFLEKGLKEKKGGLTTEEGIPYRVEHKDADVEHYKENVEYLERATRAALSEEGVKKKRVIYTLETAMDELKRVQVDAAKLANEKDKAHQEEIDKIKAEAEKDAKKVERIRETITSFLKELEEDPELLKSPSMQHLKKVFEQILKETE